MYTDAKKLKNQINYIIKNTKITGMESEEIKNELKDNCNECQILNT